MRLTVLLPILISLVAFVSGNTFKKGDSLDFYMNSVGPYKNPQETYAYYTLPLCEPDAAHLVHYNRETLGEVIMGYDLIKSAVSLKIDEDVEKAIECEQSLTLDSAHDLKVAIANDYWWSGFIDDLPVFNVLGVANEESKGISTFVFTHKQFFISTNNGKIVDVEVKMGNPVAIDPTQKLVFTYSVKWLASETEYEERFDKYLDEDFFQHKVHYFGLINTFVMVLFLVGLASTVLLRTIRKDFLKNLDDSTEATDSDSESGWKQISGDVHRTPPFVTILSAAIGCGCQLASLAFAVSIFSVVGHLFTSRGRITTTFVVLYGITSFISGYVSGAYYSFHKGKNWIQTMLFTSLLFPVVVFVLAVMMNFVGEAFGILNTIPFSTWLFMMIIWAIFCLPLCLIGTVVGRNFSFLNNVARKVNPVPHQIPEKPWYLSPFWQNALGALLPFGSIFVELYFIFAGLWHYKYYYTYGILLCVAVSFVLTSILTGVVQTYFVLNSEDYRWPWQSFLCGASAGAYVFAYSLFYYVFKTDMSGLVQFCYYFFPMAMISFGVSLACGSLTFIGGAWFVRRIYSSGKLE